MKKFLVVLAVIVILLFIIDKTILKDRGNVDHVVKVEKYKKIENPTELPVGVELENRAPDFNLTNLQGKNVSLHDYKGKKILLNFWASWCGPCRKEMPDMDQLYKKYKDNDFVVLAVNMTNTEEKEENVTNFVDTYKLTFPVVLDKKGVTTSLYEVLTYPTSYFIDSDGVIRSKVLGSLNEEYMYKEMIRLP